MQKTNNEFVETVLMAIPADMLEEVGIGPCSTVQMHVSRGRIIIQAVDERHAAACLLYTSPSPRDNV